MLQTYNCFVLNVFCICCEAFAAILHTRFLLLSKYINFVANIKLFCFGSLLVLRTTVFNDLHLFIGKTCCIHVTRFKILHKKLCMSLICLIDNSNYISREISCVVL